MKTNLLLIPRICLALPCCRANDSEILHLRNAAYSFQSLMSQAEFNAFIG